MVIMKTPSPSSDFAPGRMKPLDASATLSESNRQ